MHLTKTNVECHLRGSKTLASVKATWDNAKQPMISSRGRGIIKIVRLQSPWFLFQRGLELREAGLSDATDVPASRHPSESVAARFSHSPRVTRRSDTIYIKIRSSLLNAITAVTTPQEDSLSFFHGAPVQRYSWFMDIARSRWAVLREDRSDTCNKTRRIRASSRIHTRARVCLSLLLSLRPLGSRSLGLTSRTDSVISPLAFRKPIQTFWTERPR